MCVSCSVLSDSLRPHGLGPARFFLCPWNSPGKNTGVGGQFLLQRIFLTQGLNPSLLHCRQTLYRLSHQGSPATQFSGFKHIHLVQLSSSPISTTFVIFHYGLLQDIEYSSQPIPPPLPSPLATTSAHYFLWQEIANSSGYISNIMTQSSLKQGKNGPFSKEISSLKCNW